MKKLTTWYLILAISFFAGSIVFVNPVSASGPIHWGYEGAEGPEFWGELSPDFALCSTGQEQTPIDVPATAPANPADITFNYQPTALTIFNNGHTVQVNYDAGSSIDVGGKTYQLKQFHFHTPSEHTMNGQSTDLELHLVHQSADNQLAVVGVMLKQGSENPAYAPVFNNLPVQESEPSAVSGVTINAADLLPAERTYYRYNGSLTTPPCSEGVQWLLLNTPVELSSAQVSAFQAIFVHNARPVQPLNGRSFLQTSALTPATSAPVALPTTGGVPLPLESVVFGLGLLTTLTGLYFLRRK
ncbi:MAG: carbonate dehydratase [Anaerolineae bacterium]|nr:carbonic anhydrase family protein [Anaerolineales bacterium]MCQ3975713.1 carbonate dehydratase [Anaerolineae bacterium]